MENKFCKYCGAEITADSVFCENCGKRLENSEDKPKNSTNNSGFNNPVKLNQPFSWSDDAPTPNVITVPKLKVCRTCGANLDVKVKICPKCGASQYSVVPAKLKQCRHCGGNVASVLQKCPHCGKSTNNYTALCIGLGAIALFVLMFAFTLSKNDKPQKHSTPPKPTKTVAVETSTPVPEKKELDLYSDSEVNIKYMKLFDQSDIVKGTLYLQLRVTNNSTSNVIVRLEDVSVNKMTVTSGTAVPIKIEPGNMSVSPFILFTGNTGIVKADEVNNIRFKLEMLDENFKTLHTTTTVNVDLSF